MNCTFQSLILSRQISKSPFLDLSLHNHISLNKFKISFFSSNFIYSSKQAHSFKVSNSRFSKSLSSVIYLDSLEVEDQHYTKTLQLLDNSIVKNCFFEYCTDLSKGGAIQAKQENIILSIISSNFINCLANHNGGGVYCACQNLTIEKCCFSNCTAYSFGQALHVENRGNGLFSITDSVCFRCSTKPQRRNGGAFYFTNAGIIVEYDNFTRCQTLKNAAAISSFSSNFISFQHLHILNSSSQSTVELLYSIDKTKIQHCNFLKNKASEGSAIVLVSKETVFLHCYIEGNTKPFVDKNPGPPYNIVIQKCYYDALGLKDDVTTEMCINIGAKDFPFSNAPRFKNYCIYLGKEPKGLFLGFNIMILLAISGAIILAHILIIYPTLFIELFSSMVSGDKMAQTRRRRAALRNSSRLD